MNSQWKNDSVPAVQISWIRRPETSVSVASRRWSSMVIRSFVSRKSFVRDADYTECSNLFKRVFVSGYFMAMNKNERYTNLSLFKALLTLAWRKLARRCYDSRMFYS